MITYPISNNLSKKKIICNVISFTIFHLLEAATGGVSSVRKSVLSSLTFTGKHL